VQETDGADLAIAKRLLDYAKQGGFTFQRATFGEDGPLVGYRVSDDCVDLIHIEGFSRDCFAWRKRVSPLIVSRNALVQRQIEGSVLDVLNEVLTWETPAMTVAQRSVCPTEDTGWPPVERQPPMPGSRRPAGHQRIP
jgi:hypothetical protein